MRRKSIDELVADKIFELVNYVISFRVKPNITVGTVTELTETEIDRIKKQYGIEGVILDVDETLRKNMKAIPPANQAWIDMIKTKLKVIVLSNGVDGSVQEFFRLKGIDYIGFAHKPLSRNFRKACAKMELDPEKVLVIGDDLFSDIYGGKRHNMTTVKVTKVDDGFEL